MICSRRDGTAGLRRRFDLTATHPGGGFFCRRRIVRTGAPRSHGRPAPHAQSPAGRPRPIALDAVEFTISLGGSPALRGSKIRAPGRAPRRNQPVDGQIRTRITAQDGAPPPIFCFYSGNFCIRTRVLQAPYTLNPTFLPGPQERKPL